MLFMSSTLFPAVAAVVLAAIMAGVLFVPLVALQYRRRGQLSWGAVAFDLVVLVYVMAVLTYTLLPLPLPREDFCAAYGSPPQLRPGRFLTDIADTARDTGGGFRALATNAAVLQVLFNVALFMPLGMFVRYATRARLVVVAAMGFGVSLFVELTQLTGVWFLYPCNYRLFDVDDLIVNTGGAFLGTFFAPLLRFLPLDGRQNPARPRPIGPFRRLAGMACDLSAVALGGAILTITYRAVKPHIHHIPDVVDTVAMTYAGPVLVSLGVLAMTLKSGRTLGESVVRLRPAGQTTALPRLGRWFLGIGGHTVLSCFAPLGWVLALLVVIAIVSVFPTRHHRGASYALLGWELEDDRASSS